MNPDQPARTANHGVACIKSRYPFADTVTHLLATLRQHGIKVFATIDQQAEAAQAGLAMPPATLILFGNPKAGTPLMLARPAAGIDLPLKVFISEAAPGEVTVMFHSAAYLMERHGLPAELSANIASAERLIAAAAGA